MIASIPCTTLLKRADFLRLNRGQKYIAPCFILRALPQVEASDGCRIGYTVTTKCGNAVVRNRIKRRLRALARELLPSQGKAGIDYVVIARADTKPGAGDVEFAELRQQMEKALSYMHRKFDA